MFFTVQWRVVRMQRKILPELVEQGYTFFLLSVDYQIIDTRGSAAQISANHVVKKKVLKKSLIFFMVYFSLI
jgi:hypothetical protein